MRNSESLAKLAPALVAAMAQLENPPKTADNPFFKSKYAPLNATLDLIRPVLSEHGLCLLQSPLSVDGRPGVVSRIVHSSGEWIEGDPLTVTPQKDDPQGAGGAVTYARRYALEAMLGISGDDDDDANYSSGGHDNRAHKPAPKSPAKPAPKPKASPKPKPSSEPATPPQVPSDGSAKWLGRDGHHHMFTGLERLYVSDKATLFGLPGASKNKDEDEDKKEWVPAFALTDETPEKGECGPFGVLETVVDGGDNHPPKALLVALVQAGTTGQPQEPKDEFVEEELADDDIPF
jgi:hypothetical protein